MLRRIRRGALSRTTQQRVYAALFLAGAFVFSRGFLYTLGLDWFRYLYVMLYVGRIAVLFLFVLMSLEKGSQRHTTLRGAYGPQRRRRAGLVALGLFRRNAQEQTFLSSTGRSRLNRGIYEANLPNVLSTLLYVQWGEALLIMGVLLVLGMVGAIAISLPD
jgi:NADH-quinone oxidoreductase subunit J